MLCASKGLRLSPNSIAPLCCIPTHSTSISRHQTWLKHTTLHQTPYFQPTTTTSPLKGCTRSARRYPMGTFLVFFLTSKVAPAPPNGGKLTHSTIMPSSPPVPTTLPSPVPSNTKIHPRLLSCHFFMGSIWAPTIHLSSSDDRVLIVEYFNCMQSLNHEYALRSKDWSSTHIQQVLVGD